MVQYRRNRQEHTSKEELRKNDMQTLIVLVLVLFAIAVGGIAAVLVLLFKRVAKLGERLQTTYVAVPGTGKTDAELAAEPPASIRNPVNQKDASDKPGAPRTIARATRTQLAFLGRIVDIIPSACAIKDATDEFRYLACNDEFAAISGLPKEKIVGSVDSDLLPAEIAAVALERDKEAAASELPVIYDAYGPCPPGTVGYTMTRSKQRIDLHDGRRVIFFTLRDTMKESRRVDSEEYKVKLLNYLVDNPDFEDGVNFTAGLIMEYFGCERVVIRFFDGPRRTWSADDADEGDDGWDAAQTAAWEMFGVSDTVSVEDASALSHESWPHGVGAKAFLAARAMRNGETVVRIAALYTKGARHFFSPCVQLLKFAAETLALIQERARLQRPYQVAIANSRTMELALRELQLDETLNDLTPFLKIVCERFNADYCSLVRILDEDGGTVVDFKYEREGGSFAHYDIVEAVSGFEEAFGSNDFLELDEERLGRLWKAEGFDSDQIARADVRHAELVALRVKGRFWGAIELCHREQYRFTDVELDHLHRLADILAIAIRRHDDFEELKTAVKRAQAADRAKLFFSTVSHDIRTPLNAVIGLSQMLKLGFDTEAERNKAIDSIIVSGKTLLELVNDVLDLSKLEAGKMVISPEPTDCRRLVSEIVDSFKAAYPDTAVDIRGRTKAMPMLMIDPQRIRQIVFNLVGNAVKFTEKGFVEIRASYDYASPGSKTGTLRIEVEDTGCGLSAEEQKLIASPYVQFGKGVKKGGTGLGLAICRQLIMAMHGSLELESEVGRGTTFFITIPDVKTGTDMMRAKLSATQRISIDSAASGKTKSRYNRILIVDDSKINLMVLASMLKRFGVKDVVQAGNGREAMNILAKEPFDLVLTDMWMPELDGEGLIKEIRANPKLKDLAVMSVTADVEVRANAAAMGFNGVLLKPITFETLKDALV